MVTTNAELTETSQSLRGEVAKQTEENARLTLTSQELETEVSKLSTVVGIVGCARPHPVEDSLAPCLHDTYAVRVQRERESSAGGLVWRRGAP